MNEMQPRSGDLRLTKKFAMQILPAPDRIGLMNRAVKRRPQNDSPFQLISVAGNRQLGLQRFRSYCVPKPHRPSGFFLKKKPCTEVRDGYTNCGTALISNIGEWIQSRFRLLSDADCMPGIFVHDEIFS